MKTALLALLLGASAPAGAVAPDPAAQAMVQREQLKLLGAVQDWSDYLAKAQPEVQQKFSPELAEIKAAVEAAKAVEELKPLELRLDAWRRAMLRDLFPMLSMAWGRTTESVALAQAQVEAFQALQKLQGSSLPAGVNEKALADLKSRVGLAADTESLNRLFDNARLSRPAPLPQWVFRPAAGGGFSGFGVQPQAKGLVTHEVPSPVTVEPSDQARFAKVAEALRKRGASQKVIDLTIQEALRQKVDPLLVLALVQNESNFRTGATSGAGARGLMQVMPDTGRGLGVSDPDHLYDAQTNLRAGVRFLKGLWGQFVDFSWTNLARIDPFANSDVKKAIAAYNAGPGAVAKYNAVPPYAETRAYVVKVLRTYLELRDIYGGK